MAQEDRLTVLLEKLNEVDNNADKAYLLKEIEDTAENIRKDLDLPERDVEGSLAEATFVKREYTSISDREKVTELARERGVFEDVVSLKKSAVREELGTNVEGVETNTSTYHRTSKK